MIREVQLANSNLMHAYLLISQNSNFKSQIEELSKKLGAKILDFPLLKIEDVRNLNSMIRLTLNERTLIVSKNIHQAGTEALNAFLKNLEEPQDNVYFVLTAPSLRKVLPTISSRCQIIKVKNEELTINDKKIEEFANMTKGQKLSYIEKLTDRNTAILLVENLIDIYHSQIHSQDQSIGFAKNAEVAIKTLNNLNANGNVSLQLTNMIISLV